MDATIIKFLNEGAIHPTRAGHKRAAKSVMAKSFCSKTEANLHYQSLDSLRFNIKKFWWTYLFPSNSPYYIRQSFVIFVNFDQNHHTTSTKKNQFSIFEKKLNSWTSFSTNFRKFMAVYQGNFEQKNVEYMWWYCVFKIDIVFFWNLQIAPYYRQKKT